MSFKSLRLILVGQGIRTVDIDNDEHGTGARGSIQEALACGRFKTAGHATAVGCPCEGAQGMREGGS